MHTTLVQFLRFLTAGGTATLADFLVYTTIYPTVGFDIAKTLSFTVGITVAYFLNTFWTFARKNYSHQETVRFSVLYVGIVTLNVSINHLTLSFFPQEILLAFIGATGVSAIINFTGQKWWVFKA